MRLSAGAGQDAPGSADPQPDTIDVILFRDGRSVSIAVRGRYQAADRFVTIDPHTRDVVAVYRRTAHGEWLPTIPVTHAEGGRLVTVPVPGRYARTGFNAVNLDTGEVVAEYRRQGNQWVPRRRGGSTAQAPAADQPTLAGTDTTGPSSAEGAGVEVEAGAGSAGPVAGTELVRLPVSSVLPLEVVEAEVGLRGALADLRAAETEMNRRRVEVGWSVYLNVVAAHVGEMSAVPVQLRTPGWRQLFVDTLAAFAANMFGFTVPTIAGRFVPDPQWSIRTYAAGVAVMGLVTPDLESVIKRLLGGADAQLRLSLGRDSANVGPYKAVLGDVLLTTVNLVIYGATGTLVNLSPRFASTVGGPIGKAIVAGASMSILGQATFTAGAWYTLWRNKVLEARQLDETAHNRAIPDGIYLRNVPAWRERTNRAHKAAQLVANAVGVILGAVVMDSIMERAPFNRNTAHPSAQAAWDDVVAVGALFVIGSLFRSVFIHLFDHPGRHANRFGIAASDVMTSMIEASALERFEEMLDRAVADIDSGRWRAAGEDAAYVFDWGVEVFSGAVFRERPLGLTESLDPFVEWLRGGVEGLRGGVDRSLRLPIEGTLVKMAKTVEAVAKSLEAAGRAAGAGTDFSPELKDAKLRIRDLQALLLQSMFQLDGPAHALAQERVAGLAAGLLPLFAALRQVDRMELADAFIGSVVEHANGRRSAKQVLAGLGPGAHNRVKARDVAWKLNGLREKSSIDRYDPAAFLRASANLFTKLFAGKVPDYAASKLLMLANLLNKPPGWPDPDDFGHATPDHITDAFDALKPFAALTKPAGVVPNTWSEAGHATRTRFITALRSHVFSLEALRDALDELRAYQSGPADPSTVEAGLAPGTRAIVSTPAQARRILDNFEAMLGPDFLTALRAETPSRLSDIHHDQDTVDASTRDLFEALWADTQAIPPSHGMLAGAALSLPLPITPVGPSRDLSDAHFHPTSYSGKINSLRLLIGYMDINRIESSNLAGIPPQVWRPTNERKYYLNSPEGMAYRDHDYALAAQYEQLTPEQQKKVDLNITGIDVTNGPIIGLEMDNRLKAHPRVFTGVGPVTDKNPHKPRIGSTDTQALLKEATIRGLPIIVHNDRGVPGNKNKYAEAMVKAIREWAGRMSTFAHEEDPLKLREGINPDDVPAMKPIVIWAHGAGISRFTAESNHHTADLDEMLSDETLTDILYLDLSWDFVINDILENLRDQLSKHDVAPGLRRGLQDILKLYKSFVVQGDRADKADDMQNPNLASIYRVGAEAIAEQYYAALKHFRTQVRHAFADPATVKVFADLMAKHGTKGNNWLYLMNKHQDRLMFGTDALAVGIKAHGDAAYAMNTRAMYPIFDILDQAAQHIGGTDGIADKIGRTNYQKIFHDPKITKRRHAWEDHLRTEKATDHPAHINHPPPPTTQQNPPPTPTPTTPTDPTTATDPTTPTPPTPAEPAAVPTPGLAGVGVDVEAGAGSAGPVAGTELVRLPVSSVLPLEVVEAEVGLRGALADLRAAETEMNRRRVEVGWSVYLNVVAAHVGEMSAVPVQLRTPGWRQLFVDTLAAFAANMFGFTVPTIAGRFVPDPQWSIRTYAAGVAVMGLVTPDLESVIKRLLGGADAQLRLSLGRDSANVGPYKAVLGDVLLTTVNLVIYGATGTLVNLSPRFASTVGGPIGKAIVAGASMSILGQATFTAGAWYTLWRNKVLEARQLDETAHNRAIPDGIYLRNVPAWRERTNRAHKAAQLVANAVGVILGAVVMDSIMERAPFNRNTAHPSAQAAWDDVVAVGALFVIGSLFRSVFIHLFDHPGRHANRFGIAASDVMTSMIEASALERFEEMLDRAVADIDSGRWRAAGEDAAYVFDWGVEVFSGAVFRERPLGLTESLDPFVEWLRGGVEGLRGGVDRSLRLPIEGTLVKMAKTVEAVAKSLEAAGRAAGAGTDFSPELKDAKLRIRDLQALLLQSMFQLDGPAHALAQERVAGLAAGLLPLFAALRQVDRMELADAFIGSVVEHANGRRSAKQVLAGLGPGAHNRVKARDVAWKLNGLREKSSIDRYDPAAFLRASANLFTKLFAGKVPDYAASKLLMLANLLNKPPGWPDPDDFGHATPDHITDAFDALKPFAALTKPAGVVPNTWSEAGHATRTRFITALRSHVFSLEALRDALDELRAYQSGPADPSTVEAGLAPGTRAIVSTPAQARRILDNFEAMLGPDFLTALRAETPSRLSDIHHDQDTVDASTRDLFEALWADTQAIPPSHGMLAGAALSLPLPITPVGPSRDLSDAHFHPTSYSGKINSLRLLIGYMDINRIESSNLAGIPPQVWRPTNERKYYLNSPEGMAYRDHDYALAAQYEQLTPEQQKKVDLNITGIDVTNGPIIGLEMDNRLKAHPRVFTGVGPVTDKNPHKPRIGSTDTQALLKEATIRGLPIIVHNDRGVPGNKNKYAEAMVKAIREWAGRMSTFAHEEDPLKLREGINPDDVPAMKPIVIWAHGAGISRFTAESNHHTADLDEMLSDETLTDILYLDLSWDFVINDILENLRDQLSKHDVAPGLRRGLQDILKLYKSFVVQGDRADKADDMQNPNLASIYRVGAEAIAEQYYAALKHFRTQVRHAFADPATVKVFADLMAKHGTKGNNWLYLMNKHQDRLMFGTDALAVGIKAHGDAAYAMNTRAMYPIFDILDQAAQHIGGTDGIADKIGRTNYQKIFHDPKITKRRHAWEDHLRTEKATDHPAHINHPPPPTTQQNPPPTPTPTTPTDPTTATDPTTPTPPTPAEPAAVPTPGLAGVGVDVETGAVTQPPPGLPGPLALGHPPGGQPPQVTLAPATRTTPGRDAAQPSTGDPAPASPAAVGAGPGPAGVSTQSWRQAVQTVLPGQDPDIVLLRTLNPARVVAGLAAQHPSMSGAEASRELLAGRLKPPAGLLGSARFVLNVWVRSGVSRQRLVELFEPHPGWDGLATDQRPLSVIVAGADAAATWGPPPPRLPDLPWLGTVPLDLGVGVTAIRGQVHGVVLLTPTPTPTGSAAAGVPAWFSDGRQTWNQAAEPDRVVVVVDPALTGQQLTAAVSRLLPILPTVATQGQTSIRLQGPDPAAVVSPDLAQQLAELHPTAEFMAADAHGWVGFRHGQDPTPVPPPGGPAAPPPAVGLMTLGRGAEFGELREGVSNALDWCGRRVNWWGGRWWRMW